MVENKIVHSETKNYSMNKKNKTHQSISILKREFQPVDDDKK